MAEAKERLAFWQKAKAQMETDLMDLLTTNAECLEKLLDQPQDQNLRAEVEQRDGEITELRRKMADADKLILHYEAQMAKLGNPRQKAAVVDTPPPASVRTAAPENPPEEPLSKKRQWF